MLEEVAWIPSNLNFPLVCDAYRVFTAEHNFQFGT